MAFVYLYDKGVRPLAWLCLSEGGDHRFVVLGNMSTQITKPETWGPDAVVCDPWHESVYGPKQIIKMWGKAPLLLFVVLQ